MYELHDLEILIRSQAPVIVIETHEEPRVVALFKALSRNLKRAVFQWTVTDGLLRIDTEGMSAQAFNKEPVDVLKHIRASSQPGIYLLLDYHPYLKEPGNIRYVKEIAQRHEEVPDTLVFVSHELEIPPELSRLASHFELQLPNSRRLTGIVAEEARRGSPKPVDPKIVQSMVRNLTGLTEDDARRLARRAIVDDGALTESDLPRVMQAKYKLLNGEGGLSFEYDTSRFSDIGGMQKLKDWLARRRNIFLADKAPAGLADPKGIMLLGVQGGGKSLAAKAIAGVWGVPLLRLDFGTLYNKYIGETEKNLREAFQTAEIMAPCVLWIDEIEKGISGDSSDGGVSQRILGTLLTWMAERKSKVFLALTANNIEQLPPELIRKGRLDEIFFVDLPEAEARAEIFRIHLQKRDINTDHFDCKRLAEISTGFSGAEIEQAVIASLYNAYAEDSLLRQATLLEELLSTKPLSVVMAEKITHLRSWAAERTVSAN